MSTLVWFRRDLRTHDHEPLLQAARSGEPVFPVYVFDDEEFEETPLRSFPKTGSFRAQFLLESVANLRESLRALGSELIIRRGKPAEVIPRLASDVGARTIRYHELVGTEEQAVESELDERAAELGLEVESHWGHTLVLIRDLPFDVSQTPEVFTQFRKRCEKETTSLPPRDAPRSLPKLPPIEVGTLPDLSTLGLEPIEVDDRRVLPFEGGETNARQRLADYIWKRDALRNYKQTRNGMLGENYSSKLSPWLALGCLSPRFVASEVERYESERVANSSTYWMVFELRWRDYFQFIVEKHGRRVFRPSGLQGIPVPWSHEDDAFEAWRLGRTGYPLVDASMRELLHTGFMSNRGRQIVASFLTKNLGVDWRWGAEWFESRLIDHDVASNYGNWNYSAGVGNDARGFRYFNIATQADKYDRSGAHAKHWIPELRDIAGDEVHPAPTSAEGYPDPVVDLDASVARLRRAWESAVGRS